MPLTLKDWPLEVQDHVVLDRDIVFMSDRSGEAEIVVQAGDHGMIKACQEKGLGMKSHVVVEFGALRIKIAGSKAFQDLTLYRRSQDSKRRR